MINDAIDFITCFIMFIAVNIDYFLSANVDLSYRS